MKQGFTLIELIVVTIIIMVLLGLTIVGYSSYNEKQRVRQAALNLKSDLRMARTNATSGKKPLSCNATGETLVGYEVSFTASTYNIVPVCTVQGNVIGERVDVTLPLGVVFSAPPPTFTYYPLTRGISQVPSQIVLTDGTNTETVIVDEETVPVVTSTPTSTLTPTQTPVTCSQHCNATYGSSGNCQSDLQCNLLVLIFGFHNEGSSYNCSSPDTCCCSP